MTSVRHSISLLTKQPNNVKWENRAHLVRTSKHSCSGMMSFLFKWNWMTDDKQLSENAPSSYDYFESASLSLSVRRMRTTLLAVASQEVDEVVLGTIPTTSPTCSQVLSTSYQVV